MSVECKTRFDVQKILRANIIQGLSSLNQTGWDVKEFANSVFATGDKIILMNLVSSNRVGWQSTSYGMSDDSFNKKEDWVEQQSWQIHVILKRTSETEDTDILAEDVCQLLIAWFNGMGCEYFRRYGMANLLIDTENIFVYNDNSDLYQKRCVFTVKIQVPKEINWAETPLEAILPKIKPV